MNKVWLSLDIGTRRTGVATSTSGQLATPWGILTGSLADQLDQLLPLLDQLAVTTIVAGVPRLAKTPQSLPDHIHNFLEILKSHLAGRPIEIVLADETLSTKEVERRLGRDRRKNKADTDALAAQLILEDYLWRMTNDE